MIAQLFVSLFQLVAGDPVGSATASVPDQTTAQPSTENTDESVTVESAAPAAGPAMVCRREQAIGSIMARRVCRPAVETNADRQNRETMVDRLHELSDPTRHR